MENQIEELKKEIEALRLRLSVIENAAYYQNADSMYQHQMDSIQQYFVYC